MVKSNFMFETNILGPTLSTQEMFMSNRAWLLKNQIVCLI